MDENIREEDNNYFQWYDVFRVKPKVMPNVDNITYHYGDIGVLIHDSKESVRCLFKTGRRVEEKFSKVTYSSLVTCKKYV